MCPMIPIENIADSEQSSQTTKKKKNLNITSVRVYTKFEVALITG